VFVVNLVWSCIASVQADAVEEIAVAVSASRAAVSGAGTVRSSRTSNDGLATFERRAWLVRG
jgi:hypothetical protein